MPHLRSLLIPYLFLPHLCSYRQLMVASSSSNMNISQDNNCSKSNLGEFTGQSPLFTFVTIQFPLFLGTGRGLKLCLIKLFANPRLRLRPIYNPYLLLRPWNDVGFSWLLHVRDHVKDDGTTWDSASKTSVTLFWNLAIKHWKLSLEQPLQLPPFPVTAPLVFRSVI